MEKIHRLTAPLNDFLAIESGSDKEIVVEDEGYCKNDLVYIGYCEPEGLLKWLLVRRIVSVSRDIPHADTACCVLALV